MAAHGEWSNFRRDAYLGLNLVNLLDIFTPSSLATNGVTGCAISCWLNGYEGVGGVIGDDGTSEDYMSMSFIPFVFLYNSLVYILYSFLFIFL